MHAFFFLFLKKSFLFGFSIFFIDASTPFSQLPFLLDSRVILLAICAVYFVTVEVGDRTVGRIFFFFCTEHGNRCVFAF